MLKADIANLEQRQHILEREIVEALRHAPFDNSMLADLKSRVLFVREQIEILRPQMKMRWQ